MVVEEELLLGRLEVWFLAWFASNLSIKAFRHGVMAFSSASVKLVLFFRFIGGSVTRGGWTRGNSVSGRNTESSDSGEDGGDTLLN